MPRVQNLRRHILSTTCPSLTVSASPSEALMVIPIYLLDKVPGSRDGNRVPWGSQDLLPPSCCYYLIISKEYRTKVIRIILNACVIGRYHQTEHQDKICAYLHLSFLCGSLTVRKLKGQNSYSRAWKGRRKSRTFARNTPVRKERVSP